MDICCCCCYLTREERGNSNHSQCIYLSNREGKLDFYDNDNVKNVYTILVENNKLVLQIVIETMRWGEIKVVEKENFMKFCCYVY